MPYVTSWERIAKREGKRSGKREGIKEEKLDTARRMLNDKVLVESNAKYTMLKVEQIKGLMN